MKKKNKRRLLTILFVAIFLCATYFIDKDLFNDLKNTVYKESEKVINNIKDELNISDSEPFVAVQVENIDSIELTDDLMVFFLDVGQADCILIKSKDEYMLIDAGNNSDGKKLVNYFNFLGIKEFKYVIGTHAHEDHIGGMDDIINNFKIKNFYMPDATTTTQTFIEVLEALENKKIAFKTPKAGTKLTLGDSSIEVIHVGEDSIDLNDTSIVVKLTYFNTSFLFTGDATSTVEKEILNKNIASTVLKVGHHGSKYSSSAQFLNKVNPKYAIISCEANNEYGHPHDVVVTKLKKINTQIFRTDELGTVVAISDGESIVFKNIKTDTNGE